MPWQSDTQKERRSKYEETSIEPAAGVWHGIATAKTEGSSAIVIAPQVTGEAKKVMTEVSTQSLKDVVKNTDAALEVQTGVGSVSIPKGDGVRGYMVYEDGVFTLKNLDGGVLATLALHG